MDIFVISPRLGDGLVVDCSWLIRSYTSIVHLGAIKLIMTSISTGGSASLSEIYCRPEYSLPVHGWVGGITLPHSS